MIVQQIIRLDIPYHISLYKIWGDYGFTKFKQKMTCIVQLNNVIRKIVIIVLRCVNYYTMCM